MLFDITDQVLQYAAQKRPLRPYAHACCRGDVSADVFLFFFLSMLSLTLLRQSFPYPSPQPYYGSDGGISDIHGNTYTVAAAVPLQSGA